MQADVGDLARMLWCVGVSMWTQLHVSAGVTLGGTLGGVCGLKVTIWVGWGAGGLCACS